MLDVATGTGMVAAALVRRYGCRVVGLDQSPEMLAGRGEGSRANPELASRIELVRGEAESLPFADGEFDHLTFTYLLRYVDDPAATLRELARVVKPGGRMSSLEFMLPPNPVARALWQRVRAARAAGPRPSDLARLVRGRPIPGAEHHDLLSPTAPASGSWSSGERRDSGRLRRG